MKTRVIDGSIFLNKANLRELPNLSDVKLFGNFYCQSNEIRDLRGAPKYVNLSFDCSINRFLTSLEGAPEIVAESFSCVQCALTSLKYGPKETYNYRCYINALTSLEYAPKFILGSFTCFSNRLTTLIGAPETVGNDFLCHDNKLTSLEGAPREVGGNFNCSFNDLKTLKGAPKRVGGLFVCKGVNSRFTIQDILNVCDVDPRFIVL